MKNISVVLLAVFSLAFAGYAEAAKPKKRTRNANRIGAYGVGFAGQSHYTNDQAANQQELVDFLNGTGNPIRNLSAETEPKDLGYAATFGYRFTRYFSAEIGLAQYGSLTSKARADMDFGGGFVPVGITLEFTAGGPVISGIGILPLNDHFELFGRAGYIFASTEREFITRADGRTGAFGSAKSDSQNLVLGIGAAYHFNQVYSARFEYQRIDALGQQDGSGEEDLDVLGLGVVVRF